MSDHDDHKRAGLPEGDAQGVGHSLPSGSEEAQDQASGARHEESGRRGMERHGSSPLEGDAGLPADDVDRLVEALRAEGMPLSTAQIAAVQNIQYRRPLPPPEDLLQYNNVMPEAAERIIAMAEKSLDAKVYTSKKLAEAEAKGILAVARSAAASPFIMGLVLIVSTIKEWGVGALGGSIGLLITGAPRLIDSIRGNSEKPEEAQQ